MMDWSNAVVKTITVGATAGNVATNKSPSAGKKWKILYTRITLVTDATVANRLVMHSITDATGNVLVQLGANSTNYTASQTNYIQIIPVTLATATGVGVASLGLGTDLIISGTDRLTITVQAGVAGDSYSGYITVQEMPT